MLRILIVLVSGFVLGTTVGIVIGWAAAPAMIWAARKDLPDPATNPDAVGTTGTLLTDHW